MRRLAVPLACVALFACGGGDDIDPEADEERIEDALLTVDDLPDGFTEGEPGDDADDTNECNQDVLDIDQDDLDENQTAETEQVTFESDDAEVRARIEAFRSDDLPQQVLDAFDDDEYLDCIEDGIVERLGDVELTGFEEIDTPADGGRALELQLNAGGQDIVSQQHAVLVDRFGITLQVTVAGGEVDEGLVEDALDAMIERLEG